MTWLVLPTSVLAACTDSSKDDGRCTWGVDELLAEVGAGSSERMDCGTNNGVQTAQVQASLSCLEAATGGAEFTVNNCIDCSIPVTYVKTPQGRLFEVLMENDSFGDEFREASVRECDELSFSAAVASVVCVDATTLYDCMDEFVGDP